MSKPSHTRIAKIQDGEIATVVGTVRLLAGESATSPMGQQACAYFGVHQGLLGEGDEPIEQEAHDFLLEDDTGRARVVMDRFEVDLAGERRQSTVKAVDADINEVADRLRELKGIARSGSASAKVLAELRELRGLATVLCAVRAHAHGKIHVGKSRAEQGEYIARESARYRTAGRSKALTDLLVDRYEAVIAEGQRVAVIGYCQWEPDPDPTAQSAGYRSRAKRLAIRAPGDGGLIIRSPDGSPRRGRRRGRLAKGKPAAPPTVPLGGESRTEWAAGLVVLVLLVVGSVIAKWC